MTEQPGECYGFPELLECLILVRLDQAGYGEDPSTNGPSHHQIPEPLALEHSAPFSMQSINEIVAE
jgi:hypothetical protein